MPLIKWSAPPWPKTTAQSDKKCLSEHFPLTLLFSSALFVSSESFLSSFSSWHRGMSTELWNLIDHCWTTHEPPSYARWADQVWRYHQKAFFLANALESGGASAVTHNVPKLHHTSRLMVKGLDNPNTCFPINAIIYLFFPSTPSLVCS